MQAQARATLAARLQTLGEATAAVLTAALLLGGLMLLTNFSFEVVSKNQAQCAQHGTPHGVITLVAPPHHHC